MKKSELEALKRKLLQELEDEQQENEKLKKENAHLKRQIAFLPGTKEKEKDG